MRGGGKLAKKPLGVQLRTQLAEAGPQAICVYTRFSHPATCTAPEINQMPRKRLLSETESQ
jgi:hypothetical protein